VDLVMQAARIPAPGDQSPGRRPAELLEAAQEEMLQFHDTLLATRAHARVHAAVETANRIADGTYGTCQACGQEIPARRLQAVPFTKFCLPCQDAREQGGRDRYRLVERDE
jgi:DnaK suppressor protein